jgi:hypothetical protein
MIVQNNLFWSYSSIAYALPSFVNAGAYTSTANNGSNIPTAVIPAPSQIIQNNILIAVVSLSSSTSPLNPPIISGLLYSGTGWSLLTAVNNTISGGVSAVFWKLASNSEPSTYTFRLDAIRASTAVGEGQIFQFKNGYWNKEIFSAFYNSGSMFTGAEFSTPTNSLEFFVSQNLSGTNIPTLPSGMTSISAASETTNTTSIQVATLNNLSGGTLTAPTSTTTNSLSSSGGFVSNFILSSLPTYNRILLLPIVSGTATYNVPAFSVPSNALICVTVIFNQQTTNPTVTDSAGNLYISTPHYSDPNSYYDSQSFYVLSSVASSANVITISGVTSGYFVASIACYTKPTGSWAFDTNFALTANYQTFATGSFTTGAPSLIVGACSDYYTGTDAYMYSYPAFPISHAFNGVGSPVSSLEFYSPLAATYSSFIYDLWVGRTYGGRPAINLVSFI